MSETANQYLLSVLETAEQGVRNYLSESLDAGRIDQQLCDVALENVIPNLRNWATDPEIGRISPGLQDGLIQAIQEERWEEIVNAYRQSVRFGTGGIRGMMAFDRKSIIRLAEQGIHVPVLKGPNTINEIVLLKTSVGVAQFGKDQSKPFEKVVIGYDSRVRGHDLARTVAELFLAFGYTVFFFDEPCPYPEVTYAIPDPDIKADVGIFISASHNDYRYNGYKLSCCNGSQFDPQERNEMYDKYIAHAQTKDIKLMSFAEAKRGKLVFLGGAEPVAGFDYAGHDQQLINLHKRHCSHVKSFLLMDTLAKSQKQTPLHIAFCAYHGAGAKAVPRLLHEVGFVDVRSIRARGLNEPNGLFPCFCSDPGQEEQPDPGDPHAAEIAVTAFKEEYGHTAFDEIDILIGTDPDADRCGVTVKVPPEQRELYEGKDYALLPADDLWALVVWYRLQQDIERYGAVRNVDKQFIVLSHTTSDSIVRVARKFGLGVIKTWVGFAALAAGVRDAWEGRPFETLIDGRKDPSEALCHPFAMEYQAMNKDRSINVAAMEQSNGFSILGGPPADASSMGTEGHVRDKDGTFAALLAAEIAAWAKQRGMSLMELLDNQIYLDPAVGLFVSHYEPDPLVGEYPGIEGDRKKLEILRRALDCYQRALDGELKIAGQEVRSATIYRTGKYDRIYPPTQEFQFPDEGVRFFFDDSKLCHLTVRPSGTGNSLRFHVQLRASATEENLIDQKRRLRREAASVVDHVRELLQAPRNG